MSVTDPLDFSGFETAALQQARPPGPILRFFIEAVENKFKSAEAGRPIYDNVEMISIINPGSKDEFIKKVDASARQRFGPQYEHWKRTQEQPGEGTPLDMVPFLNPAQVRELKALASSTATDAMQLLRLLNAGARQLIKDHHWSKLLKVKTFTGVAAQAQTGQPPANFDRFAPLTQLWDVNKRLPLLGAVSAEKWLLLLAQNVTGADKYWTMIEGVINVTPAPATSDSFRYSYVSRYFARPTGKTSDTNDKAAFSIDTDESRLSEELLTLDLVWRWKKAKQLDYAEDLADFERQKEMDIAADP